MGTEELDDISRFYTYGFLPELIARFHRVIPFQPLDDDTLRDILFIKLRRYVREFEEEGLSLIVEPEVINFIVQQAIKKETGARALDAVIGSAIEEYAFELFGNDNSGRVVVSLKKGEIKCKFEARA